MNTNDTRFLGKQNLKSVACISFVHLDSISAKIQLLCKGLRGLTTKKSLKAEWGIQKEALNITEEHSMHDFKTEREWHICKPAKTLST